MNQMINLGGSIVSKNILNEKGSIRWIFREKFAHPVDNGWRFLSDIDTDEFLSDSNNLVVCKWETIYEIEPLIGKIFNYPIGSELELVIEEGKKFLIDSKSGVKI